MIAEKTQYASFSQYLVIFIVGPRHWYSEYMKLSVVKTSFTNNVIQG